MPEVSEDTRLGHRDNQSRNQARPNDPPPFPSVVPAQNNQHKCDYSSWHSLSSLILITHSHLLLSLSLSLMIVGVSVRVSPAAHRSEASQGHERIPTR